MNITVELSVVVPVYRCGPCLEPLYSRTKSVLSTIAPDHEILFVDDASPDDSAQILARLAVLDPRVRVVSLPVNQGQPAAIAAGIAHARGRWVAVMDGDLQDPPEVLTEFLAVARAGSEIVVGRRRAHPRAAWRRETSRLFAALVRVRGGSQLIGTHGLFSAISRRAVEGYLRCDERFVAYLAVLEALGLPIASVDYDRDERVVGTSSYSVSRLVRRAWRVLKMGPIAGPG